MNHEEEFNVEGYDAFKDEPLFQDLEYQDEVHAGHGHDPHAAYQEEAYDGEAEEEGDLDDENFPEPSEADGGKKKPSRGRMIALATAGLFTVVLGGGYLYSPDTFASLPSMISGVFMGAPAEQAAEPAPEPSVAKPHKHHSPASPKGADDSAQTAANVNAVDGVPAPPPAKHPVKPKVAPSSDAAQTAAKPAADAPKPGGVEFKTATKKVAKAVVAAAVVAKAHVAAKSSHPTKLKSAHPAKGANGPTASIAFAVGSYWVSAGEIERLWAYASHLKANSGQLTVESWAGTAEKDSYALSRKRANRVAELLSKNTPAHAYKVTVKIHGSAKAKLAARKVNVSFSSKL